MNLKFFYTQNFFGPTNIFRAKHFFDTKIFFDPKFLWTLNFISTNIFFGPKSFFGPKILLCQQSFCSKIFSDLKLSWTIFLDLKFFQTQNFFQSFTKLNTFDLSLVFSFQSKIQESDQMILPPNAWSWSLITWAFTGPTPLPPC